MVDATIHRPRHRCQMYSIKKANFIVLFMIIKADSIYVYVGLSVCFLYIRFLKPNL